MISDKAQDPCRISPDAAGSSRYEAPPALSDLSLSITGGQLVTGGYMPGTTISLTASCSNAHHIGVCVTPPDGQAEWFVADGSVYSWQYTLSTAGSYTVYAAARNTPEPAYGETIPGTARIETAPQTVNVPAPVQPSISASSTSGTSITWDAVYPYSGLDGNMLDIYNSNTEQLAVRVENSKNSGAYTTNGLEPTTRYRAVLTYPGGFMEAYASTKSGTVPLLNPTQFLTASGYLAEHYEVTARLTGQNLVHAAAVVKGPDEKVIETWAIGTGDNNLRDIKFTPPELGIYSIYLAVWDTPDGVPDESSNVVTRNEIINVEYTDVNQYLQKRFNIKHNYLSLSSDGKVALDNVPLNLDSLAKPQEIDISVQSIFSGIQKDHVPALPPPTIDQHSIADNGIYIGPAVNINVSGYNCDHAAVFIGGSWASNMVRVSGDFSAGVYSTSHTFSSPGSYDIHISANNAREYLDYGIITSTPDVRIDIIIPHQFSQLVKDAQDYLASLGYYPGAADGYYGSQELTSAIDAFQNYCIERGHGNISRTGILDRTTFDLLQEVVQSGAGWGNPAVNWNAVNSIIAGVNGDQSQVLAQGCLNVIGFPVGAVDGIWGDKSSSSAKAFQKMAGLIENGNAPDTLPKLMEYIEGSRTYRSIVRVAAAQNIGFTVDRNNTMGERVNAIYYYSILDELASGVPAEITTAQSIVESSAGYAVPVDDPSISGVDGGIRIFGGFSYNMFGIKADSSYRTNGGRYVMSWTKEWEDGRYVDTPAPFRCYDGYNGSITDHSAFLAGNSRYSPLFQIPGTDPGYLQKWAQGLKDAGYATEPAYAELLTTYINSYSLKRL